MSNPIVTSSITQNPSPFPESGQGTLTAVRAQVDLIMAQFAKVLPSNYVSQINGPFYMLQFQAAAEQIAKFQLAAQEIYKDTDYDYTRPEFLWELLGVLVFPGATNKGGAVQIEGDTVLREFLKQMVLLLLKGATKSAVLSGVELLDPSGDSTVTIMERYLEARQSGASPIRTIDDQFLFDVFIEVAGGTAFPADPIRMWLNIAPVMDALRPAHTLYSYTNLFRETLGGVLSDASSWTLSNYYYDDTRKYWGGIKQIVGTGSILPGRFLFSDPHKDMSSVPANEGTYLRILLGANAGQYLITGVLYFAVSDTTARAYTTTPSGLSGTCTVSNDGVVTDVLQDWSNAVEGEILTILTGLNAGQYRLKTLLGQHGGDLGTVNAVGAATQVRISPSLIQVSTRFPATGSVSYTIDCDRLGVKSPVSVVGEDLSEQFFL